MAASAMASLPFIKILCAIKASLFLNGYDAIRTHGSAEGTADTLFHVGHHSRGVTFVVDLICGNGQNALRAGGNTKSAAFAQIGLERYFCHMSSSLW
jgi:hypothetical protein